MIFKKYLEKKEINKNRKTKYLFFQVVREKIADISNRTVPDRTGPEPLLNNNNSFDVDITLFKMKKNFFDSISDFASLL